MSARGHRDVQPFSLPASPPNGRSLRRKTKTIIVSAWTGNFDPGIAIVDAARKVVAQNDDVRPGDQRAQVVFRSPKAGDYKVLVKSFKGNAGGSYQFSIRRFVAPEARLGARTAGSTGKAASVAALRGARGSDDGGLRAVVGLPDMLVVRPNGDIVNPGAGSLATDRVRRVVFRVDASGDHYVQLDPQGRTDVTFALTLAEARVAPIAVGTPTRGQKLEPGGLDLWTFEGKIGDLIRVEAQTSATGLEASVSYLPHAGAAPGSDNPLEVLPSKAKSPGVVTVLLKRTGTFQVTVSQSMDLPTDYSLALGRTAKPLPDRADQPATLALGDSEYWTFEGARGQILRLEGAAEQFDLELELYNPRGELLSGNDDGGAARNPLMTALLPESGRYILRASSFGDGGGGAYRIKRAPSPIRALGVGAPSAGSVGSGGTEIWSFGGRAGQTVLVSVRSQEFDTSMQIVGPDGLEVASDDNGGDGTDSLVSFRLPLAGTYTIWVLGNEGSGRYTVRWIDLDK